VKATIQTVDESGIYPLGQTTGVTSYTILNYGAMTLLCDGTNWIAF
jgi:hypothetical protein